MGAADRDFYDALETRDPAAREAALLAALPHQVANARQNTEAFGELLGEVEPDLVRTRDALARLPVTRKSELLARQQAVRADAGRVPFEPFGGFSTIGWRGLKRDGGARRVFQSPGSIYDPEGHGRDYWRVGPPHHPAGQRAGDLVHNTFS